jgi:serine/threonine-protein kinase SRPK3
MFEGEGLFDSVDAENDGEYDHIHLAQVTALMGPPPKHLLARGQRTSKFFHFDGSSLRSRLAGHWLTQV